MLQLRTSSPARRFSLAAALSLALGGGLALAAHGRGGSGSSALAAGRSLFMSKCAVCHKPDGSGQSYLGPKANLHRTAVQKKSDAELEAFIKKGFPPMPAWNGVLTETQIKSVVRYIRTFKSGKH